MLHASQPSLGTGLGMIVLGDDARYGDLGRSPVLRPLDGVARSPKPGRSA